MDFQGLQDSRCGTRPAALEQPVLPGMGKRTRHSPREFFGGQRQGAATALPERRWG
ncbi:hypothetical protein NBH08_10505 [Faecalicatena sp. BF-R-105]|nr:hypothetical protein [Faecalicatena sp. BF-R-105]